jgi:hypothetical protein
MEPEGSSPCSQEPATCPYPEPIESNPHPQTLFPLRSVLRGDKGIEKNKKEMKKRKVRKRIKNKQKKEMRMERKRICASY